jgi:hypothetical protein
VRRRVELRCDNLYWMREEEDAASCIHAQKNTGALGPPSTANWFALAEQVEWLQGQEIGTFEPSGHSYSANQRRNQPQREARVADWTARGYARGDYGRQGFSRNFW